MTRVREHPGTLLWLTAVWVGLWGSVTWANVLGGVVVALGLLLLLPSGLPQPTGRIRPLPLLGYLVFFLGELVKASLVVTWQVLRPGRALQQAVLAVRLPDADERLLTVVANSVSLTPGTLTIEVDLERGVLYVHALDVGGRDGVEGARRSIHHLAERARRAVGPHAPGPREGAAA